MSLVSQSIHSLIDGISQQPQSSRQSSQGDVQENALSHWVRGLRRRPPTQQVAKISSTTAGYTAAFVHQVRQAVSDKYAVVVVAGDLKVYDLATGASQTVVFPKGKAYLTSTKGFKALTVGDTTYLLNLDTVVKRGTHKASLQVAEALIFVRQSDFSTRYVVTLNGVDVAVTTPDGATAQARPAIATDVLASELIQALFAVPQFASDFDMQLFGSTIYVKRLNSGEFTIAVADGLADKGLRVIKGSVQTFADLPERAKNGMIVQVVGDPGSNADNFWVTYTDDTLPGQMGIWKECAAPGTPIDLDDTTMPWTLARRGEVINGLVGDPAPPAPSISSGSTTTVGGFTEDPDDVLVTYTGDEDIVLEREDQKVDGLLTGVDGTERRVRVHYDVDMTTVDVGTSLDVTLWINTGSGFVLRATNIYTVGQLLQTEILEYVGNIPTASHVRIQINYGFAGTPHKDSRTALVTVHRSSSSIGGGTTNTYTSNSVISFPLTAKYPVGAVLTMRFLSSTQTVLTTYVYTVSGHDQTGVEVATGLYSLASGSPYFATNGTPGQVAFAGTPITWTVSVTVTSPTLTLYVSGGAFTTGEHVGRIIFNETDGSSGTVTANSTDSITVTSLTGGISNQFHPGDICHINGTATDFVFTPGIWSDRAAGDLDLCPMPSFVDRSINEIFFYQNRLGLTANQFIVLSESGDSGNFMRRTATALLPSDVIDIRSSHTDVTSFDSAVEWQDFLFLGSGAGHQFALRGDPVLTPTTVRLDHLASFPMSGVVRPITLGARLYFLRNKSAFAQLMNAYQTINDKADARDLSTLVPEYLAGLPLALTGDAAMEFIAVLTADATDSLFVYSYHFDGPGNVYTEPQMLQSSWSKWTFSGATIIAVAMADGLLSLVTVRSDGVYLEKIDVGVLPAGASSHLDRGVTTVPFRYRLSTLFFRDRNEMPDTRGRLQLNYITFKYHDATDFTVTVTPDGRSAHTYTYHSGAAASGLFQVPILTRNTTVTVEITNNTAGGCAFSGLDWEGKLTTRARAG